MSEEQKVIEVIARDRWGNVIMYRTQDQDGMSVVVITKALFKELTTPWVPSMGVSYIREKDISDRDKKWN